MNKFLSFLSTAVLAVFLLFNAFFMTVFDNDMYARQFEQHGVRVAFAGEDIVAINNNLLSFLNGGELAAGDFFNAVEHSHLVDVQDLFALLRLIYASLLASLLPLLYFSSKHRQAFAQVIRRTFYAVWGSGLVLFLASPFFEKLFYQLHLGLFDNQNWLLNPETSNLINMYPLEIFFYIFIRILVIWLLSIAILYLLVLFLGKQRAQDK